MGVVTTTDGQVVSFDERGRVLVEEESPLGSERVTVGAAVVGLNPPPRAAVALIQCLANPLRFVAHGGVPAAAVGLRLAANDMIRLEGFNTLHGFRAIREGAADATLEAHYFTQELAVPPK